MTDLPYLDARTLNALVPMRRAVQVLRDALSGGLDPERTPQRPVVDLPAGQLLLMPAATSGYAGVKIATVAPGNPGLGLPRVQGVYLLLNARTLTPLAAMDGIALTSLRTPAVSALAAAYLAGSGARELVVFGTGPQAAGHIAAFRAIRPITRVTVVGRDPGRTARFAAEHSAAGLTPASEPYPSRGGPWPGEADCSGPDYSGPDCSGPDGPGPDGSRPGDAGADGAEPGGVESAGRESGGGGRGEERLAEALARADLIACCTTARTPLFDGTHVKDGAVVVAVGSHEPAVRELPGDLVARATLVVEARSAALAEAGDVMIPLADGTIGADHIAGDLADLVNGAVRPGPGPRVFKSVGMAWEDLVVASAAYEAWAGAPAPFETEGGLGG